MHSLFGITKVRKAAFVICLALFFFAPFVVHAQEAAMGVPVVLVQPDSVTVKKGDVFNVSVIIENLPANDGMDGADFILTWNNTILKALSMNEVVFHEIAPQSEWDNIWQIRLTFNNTKGEAEDACLWLDPHRAVDGGYCPVNGISGNQTLAILTMEAVEAGSTTLHLPSVLVADLRANPLVDIENEHTLEVPKIDPSENVSFPKPNPTPMPENVSALLANLTANWTYVEFTPCIATPPIGEVVPVQQNVTEVVPASAQTVPSQNNVTEVVPMSTRVAPSQNNVTEIQKQDALEVTQVPFVMLATMSGMFIALPVCWRRVRRED